MIFKINPTFILFIDLVLINSLSNPLSLSAKYVEKVNLNDLKIQAHVNFIVTGLASHPSIKMVLDKNAKLHLNKSRFSTC